MHVPPSVGCRATLARSAPLAHTIPPQRQALLPPASLLPRPPAHRSWHKDPNSTSAWNGVVKGRKKWVMYPPHVTPPGVRPSADGADVASPVSIMEW